VPASPTKDNTAVYLKGEWTGPGTKWLRGRKRIELAMLFGVSVGTIDGWVVRSGMPKASAKDGYYLPAVVQWHAQFQGSNKKSASDKSIENQEIAERTRGRKLKNDQLAQGLVDKGEVIRAHDQLVHLITSRLEELPDAVASAVPESVAEIVRAVVEAQIDLARKELATSRLGV